jgi:hypothetical protein
MGQGSARGKLNISIDAIDIVDIKRAAIEIHYAQNSLYKLVLCRELKPFWEHNAEQGHPDLA